MSSSRSRTLARAIGGMLIVLSVVGLVVGGFLLGERLGARTASVAVVGPGPSGGPPSASTSPSVGAPVAPVGPTVRLIGAGDIGECGSSGVRATANIVDSLEGMVFTAGDNSYPKGTAAELKKCYDPTWGRFKERTRPAIGNHDIRTQNGQPYFDYFGAAAGTPLDGWYSFEAGTWHVVVLDSNCLQGTDCGEGSRQLSWLRADLAAHPTACTLAIWHHPRFSSGLHGDEPAVDPFWRALSAAGAELIVNGHEHDYERFAPQTPDGRLDPLGGIREFIVGTGGAELRRFKTAMPNSEVREAGSFGVLVLDLAPGGYQWHFISTSRHAFADAGSGVCH